MAKTAEEQEAFRRLVVLHGDMPNSASVVQRLIDYFQRLVALEEATAEGQNQANVSPGSPAKKEHRSG
jgi:hypothetical protein